MAALLQRLKTVNVECCTMMGMDICNHTAPAHCTARCATTFVPFHDDCKIKIDALYDSADGREDGNAQVMSSLYRKCLALPAPVMLASITASQQMSCTVNVSGFYAERPGPPPPPHNCTDNDAAMLKINHQSCKSVKASGFCAFMANSAMSKLCSCSCPPKPANHGHRVLQIQYSGSNGCAMSQFDARAADINKQCCGANDIDDRCQKAGVPETCDVECAQHFVPFFKDCNHMLHVLMPPGKMPAFAMLNKTCVEDLPVDGMAVALGKRTHCGADEIRKQDRSTALHQCTQVACYMQCAH